MKLRSKDLIDALFASMGYRVEKFRAKNAADVVSSDPFLAQQGIVEKLGVGSPVVFDVGANKGDTVELYREMFPDGTVHCFEPFPDTVAMLESRFGRDDKVKIVASAVSTQVGTTSFFVNHASATNSLLPISDNSARFYPEVTKPEGEIEVSTVDLDSYCDEHAIETINILKLDIQGGELMALGGAERLLRDSRIDVVYSEIQFVPLYEGAAQFDGVWAKMREFGYALFDVYDLHRSAGGQLVYGDAMFVSSRVHERVIRRLAQT